jgi:hypothetical protein
MKFYNKGWIVNPEKLASLQRYSGLTSAGVAAATCDRRLPFNRALDSATLEHFSPVSGNYLQCVRGTGIGDLMYTSLSVSLGTFSPTSTGRGLFSDREPARAARGRIASARTQPDGKSLLSRRGRIRLDRIRLLQGSRRGAGKSGEADRARARSRRSMHMIMHAQTVKGGCQECSNYSSCGSGAYRPHPVALLSRSRMIRTRF